MPDLSFYRDRRVFITGHTGFKGAWLSLILIGAGARVTGYALAPNTEPSLWNLLGLDGEMHSVIGDVRDFAVLKAAFDEAAPEIVFHLAAQPIVRIGYNNPRSTYETNVMGTVNLLECVRLSDCAKSVLNVTTDKVYDNRELTRGYREGEPLDGFDPYSNSKSCSELVTHSYRRSFLSNRDICVSTARAGNVIGGGDFAPDRIIPDCVRAVLRGESIAVRSPYSTRPYQHVLEPLFAYLLIAQRQYEDSAYADCYNVGPDDNGCATTGELTTLFCDAWGNDAAWETGGAGGPHESRYLKLDCTKLKNTFGWSPRWNIRKSVEKTVAWYRAFSQGRNMRDFSQEQIAEFRRKEAPDV